MGAQTSQPLMPLISKDPFPVNAGPTKVEQWVGADLRMPVSGPCPMPHVPVFAPLPGRDAVGRICVEDGLGRLDVGFPECYVTTASCGHFADIAFGLMFTEAELLAKRVEGGMLAFCVLDESRVMCVQRGSFTVASVAFGDKVTATFPARVAAWVGLSLQQLNEVRGRLFRSYKEHGVGALVMDAGGFTFHVLVPNAQEYAMHQEVYDCDTRGTFIPGVVTPSPSTSALPVPLKTEPRSPSPPTSALAVPLKTEPRSPAPSTSALTVSPSPAVKTEPHSPSPTAFTFDVPPSPPPGEAGRFVSLDEEEEHEAEESVEWYTMDLPGSPPRVVRYALDQPTAPRKRCKFDAEVEAMVRERKV